MGGASMTVSNETISKMQALPAERLSVVMNVIDQMALSSSMDIFTALCVNGSENPMTDDEIAQFVSSVRKERNANSN